MARNDQWRVCPHNPDICCYAKECHNECEYLPIDPNTLKSEIENEDPDIVEEVDANQEDGL